MERTAVVILAGGLSRRMGRDKAQVELGGEPLLARQVRRWRAHFPSVWVSVDRPGRFDTYGAGELCDLRPGNQGPLAGLEARFGLTEGQVKSRLHRTRKRLRKLLEQEGMGL